MVLEGSTVKWLIQVCDTLHANNRDREVNGMIEAMEFFNLKTGHILSLNQSDNLKIDGREIIVHPAREFFL